MKVDYSFRLASNCHPYTLSQLHLCVSQSFVAFKKSSTQCSFFSLFITLALKFIHCSAVIFFVLRPLISRNSLSILSDDMLSFFNPLLEFCMPKIFFYTTFQGKKNLNPQQQIPNDILIHLTAVISFVFIVCILIFFNSFASKMFQFGSLNVLMLRKRHVCVAHTFDSPT